jgi:hypothetical protein
VLAACSDASSDSRSGATVPRATTTTDPYAVPATIDIPYLNRVFLALDHIDGDARRMILAAKRITPQAADLLHSIVTDAEFKVQADIWNDFIDQGAPGMRADPGDRKTTVLRVIRAGASCVALDVQRNYNAIRVEPKDPSATKVSLVRRAAVPPNPTPWAIAGEGTVRGGDTCVG